MSHYADYKDFIVTNTISEEEHYEYYLGENKFQDYEYYPKNPVSEEEWYKYITPKSEQKIFYVYVYLDPRRPGIWKAMGKTFLFEPFYIGKGTKNRLMVHLYIAQKSKTDPKNRHKSNRIKNILDQGYEPIISILYDQMTEPQSFQLETQFIKKLGRRNTGTGPLTNKTDGGEGTSGRVISKDERELISKRTSEYLASLSEEDRLVWRRNCSIGHQNRPQEKKDATAKLKSDNHHRIVAEDPEFLTRRGEAIAVGRNAMSPEAKKKQADSVRANARKRTPEEKRAASDHKRQMTPEQKAQMVSRWRASMAKKSKAELQEIVDKRAEACSDTCANRSPEEKAELNKKLILAQSKVNKKAKGKKLVRSLGLRSQEDKDLQIQRGKDTKARNAANA